MENVFNDEVVNAVVTIDEVVSAKKKSGIKGFLIGSSLVGASWLATGLVKKFKERKAKEETEQEVIE